VIAKIAQAKPAIIINTLNGDSNVAFFKQMAAAGLDPKKIPVMSFSIGEQEAQAMGTALVEDPMPAGTISRACRARKTPNSLTPIARNMAPMRPSPIR
jgi:ABC-type branched-subunit amino acid transport system substrate-binding protein